MRHDIVANSCRICLKAEKELISIYKPLENGDKTPREMLQEIAGIVLKEVYENPALPKSICKICIPSLNQAFRFRRKILESQQIISNHLLKECENAVVQAKQELKEEEIETDEEFQYFTEPKRVEPEMPLYRNVAMEKGEQVENIFFDIKVEEEFVKENSCNGNNDCNVQTFGNGNDDGNSINVSDSITNSLNTKENLNENDSVAKVQKIAASEETCDICGKSFAKRKCMMLHRQRHDAKFQHICSKCDKRFKKLWELKRHEIAHNDHRAYVCNVCNKSFKTSGSLQKHVARHIDSKLHHCNFCNMDFLQRDLNKHEKSKGHQNAVDEIHLEENSGSATKHSSLQSLSNFDDDCDNDIKVSDSKTNSPNTRKTHSENNSIVKMQISCASGETSNKSDDRKDDSEGDYICDICGKTFAIRKYLLKHRRRHYADFRHTCTVCDKRFKMLSELKRHTKVHTDHRPYVCDICNKAFNRLDVFKKHKSRHAGVKRDEKTKHLRAIRPAQ